MTVVPPLDFQMVHKPICSWSPNDKVTHGVEAARGLAHSDAARASNNRRTSFDLLPCKAVQNIWDDRNKYETMMSLFAGSHVGSPNAYPPPLHVDNPPLEHPTRPVVDIDIEYVHGVVGANSFSYCEAQGAMGLYGLPSLLNHSCLPSAHRTFACDAIVVRACRDMKKGEEVTVPYIAPSVPYDERRLRLMRSWKFKCTCELCEADSKDDIKAREKRRTIMKTLGQTMHTLHQISDKQQLKRLAEESMKLCEDMKKTYNSAHTVLTGGFTVKSELSAAYRVCSFVVERRGRVAGDPNVFLQSMGLKMDTLECIGTKVTDRNLIGTGGRKTLPVDCGRLSTDHTGVFLPCSSS